MLLNRLVLLQITTKLKLSCKLNLKFKLTLIALALYGGYKNLQMPVHLCRTTSELLNSSTVLCNNNSYKFMIFYLIFFPWTMFTTANG